jgi:nitronate monooxygenase
VLVTVTSAAEAVLAARAGASGLCVQGAEAGAHQGSFDNRSGASPLDALLREVRAEVSLPLFAAGGLMTGEDIAGVLAEGATAAQLGTAFLCCPEAGTSETHRRALLEGPYQETRLTRVFTGRTARGLVNDFLRAFDPVAPSGYPWVHHLTSPLRAAAAQQGDAEALHLWAGVGWRRIRPVPAAELVARLAHEATSAR